jgi:undecaprenyl phosphate-alpha-L-ara4N flippase subunit ArnE
VSTQYLALISFAFLLALGQILFKYAAQTSPRVESLVGVTGLLFNPYLWAAGVLYAAATVLWLMILQHVPLSRAYVFAALGFAIVPLASAALFGDTLSPRFLFGAALIIAGVYLAGAAPVR